MVNDLFLFLLRAASLIHPLGEGGKLKLLNDFVQFEYSVGLLLLGTGVSAADCGGAFSQTRLFRYPLVLLLLHLACRLKYDSLASFCSWSWRKLFPSRNSTQ